MFTKGIVQSVAQGNSNVYIVRLPLFEGSGNSTPVCLEATACIPPGHFGGFNVGDVVFVDFENDRVDRPIIIGKLYTSPMDETGNKNIFVCEDLRVCKQATVPALTNISYSEVSDVAKTSLAEPPSTLLDVITTVQDHARLISQLAPSGTSYKLDEKAIGLAQGLATDGAASHFIIADQNTPQTLCYRGANGELSIGNPSEKNHAATKEYVDLQLSALQLRLERLEALLEGSTNT